MKLHFFCWAIKTRGNINTVKQWIQEKFSSHFHIWGIEPTVNRALVFAVADGLIQQDGAQYIITEKGKQLYKLIADDNELYQKEMQFLGDIGKNLISEQKIVELTSRFF